MKESGKNAQPQPAVRSANKTERINFKEILKGIGSSILVFLILYNLNNLLSSFIDIIPEPMAELFPLPLIIGFIMVLIGLGFYFNQKNTET